MFIYLREDRMPLPAQTNGMIRERLPSRTLFLAGLWIRIHFLRIRIQWIRMEANTDPDPDPIRIQGFNDQKLKKNYS